MTKERVLWINAGGTIVSEPYDDPSNAPVNVKPLPLHEAEGLMLSAMIELKMDERVDGFAFQEYDPSRLERFNKDSKKITQEDIDALANIIKNDSHRLVLINNGTDWIAANGIKLQQRLHELGVQDKTVVMAGAMVPLIMRSRYKSDAPNNLRTAFEGLDTLKPGVYLVGRDAQTKRMHCFNPAIWEKDGAISKADLSLTFRRRKTPGLKLSDFDSQLFGGP